MTRQPLLLKVAPTTVKLYRRKGRRYLYAKIILEGVLHRRSCFTTDKPTAKRVAAAWRKQLERRGKPHPVKCYIDKL